MGNSSPEIADYIRRVPLVQVQSFESWTTQRIMPVFATPDFGRIWSDALMRNATFVLFTTGLFHLFEQQIIQVVRWTEGQGRETWRQMEMAEVARWFARLGVDVTSCPDWEKVNTELRHVANTMKHAEGHSASELRRLRPELFMYTHIRESLDGLDARVLDAPAFYRSNADVPVATPLAGSGPYIMPKDFDEYANAVRGFWSWLADRLEAVESKQVR